MVVIIALLNGLCNHHSFLPQLHCICCLMPQNYTNRNRRKRLRRKRAQPSRSTPDCNRGVVGAPLGGMAVAGIGLGLRGAPPATALANISLKPEWTKGRSQTEPRQNQTVSPLPSSECWGLLKHLFFCERCWSIFNFVVIVVLIS